MDFSSGSFSGALAAAFELRSSNRLRSSTSSSSSSFLELSSTDDELSIGASPASARDSSWSSIDNRDPFSASAKPVDGLKLYSLPDASPPVVRGGVSERGRVHVDITPKCGANSVRSGVDGRREHEDASDSTPVYRPPSEIARRLFEDTVPISEAEYWDTILSDAIDNANGCLDLSFPPRFAGHFHGQLTYIPPNISDLRKLVVLSAKYPTGASAPLARSFTRTSSAPASYNFRNRLSTGSHLPSTVVFHPGGAHYSSPNGTTESQREARIELYLTGNALHSLPRELFSLKGLTVLILRNNQIDYLPPSIYSLTSLKELSISHNRLRYLPAEILQLPLDSLLLHPNPLLTPPATPKGRQLPPGGEVPPRRRRVLGPRTRHWPGQGPVPPLQEIAYRVLLSPMDPTAAQLDGQVLNWQMYDADEWFTRGPKYQEVFQILKAATADYNAVRHKDSVLDAQSDSSRHYPSTFTPLLRTAAYFPHNCSSSVHRPHRRMLSRSTTSQRFPNEQHTFPRIARRAGLAHSHSQVLPVTSPPTHIPTSDPSQPSTYLSHAEEQLEWVNQIGRVKFPSSSPVPILWRGCSNGCLSFLDDDGKGGSSRRFEAPSERIRLAGSIVAVDSQRTIRPESFDEEEEEPTVQDGFDIDDLDELGA